MPKALAPNADPPDPKGLLLEAAWANGLRDEPNTGTSFLASFAPNAEEPLAPKALDPKALEPKSVLPEESVLPAKLKADLAAESGLSAACPNADD